jgi:hypothetical protein
MLRTLIKIAAAGLVTGAFVLACSSTGSSSSCMTSGSGGGNPAACESCLQSNCGSQFSAAESACSALIACESACACTDDACLAACSTKDVTASCETASEAVGPCEEQHCASECITTSMGSSSSSTSSGSSTGNCATLSTCCGMLPSADQTGCNDIVSLGDDSDCATALSEFETAGECTG